MNPRIPLFSAWLAVSLLAASFAPMAHAASNIAQCPEMHGKYEVPGKRGVLFSIEQGARYDRLTYAFDGDMYMVDNDDHVREDGTIYSTQCKDGTLSITATLGGKVTITTYVVSFTEGESEDVVRTITSKGSKAPPKVDRFRGSEEHLLPAHKPAECLEFAKHTFEYFGPSRYELVSKSEEEDEDDDRPRTRVLKPATPADYFEFNAVRVPNGVRTNLNGEHIIDGQTREGPAGLYRGACNSDGIYIHNLSDNTVDKYVLERSGLQATLSWYKDVENFSLPIEYKAVSR
jgi:hypothetical protein